MSISLCLPSVFFRFDRLSIFCCFERHGGVILLHVSTFANPFISVHTFLLSKYHSRTTWRRIVATVLQGNIGCTCHHANCNWIHIVADFMCEYKIINLRSYHQRLLRHRSRARKMQDTRIAGKTRRRIGKTRSKTALCRHRPRSTSATRPLCRRLTPRCSKSLPLATALSPQTRVNPNAAPWWSKIPRASRRAKRRKPNASATPAPSCQANPSPAMPTTTTRDEKDKRHIAWDSC